MILDDEFAAHSTLGPSAAHRYRRCPGSVAMEARFPNKAGIEAAKGTVFHEFAATALEFGIDPGEFIGATMAVEDHGVLTFDSEMASKMRPGLDYLYALSSGDQVEIFVEVRVMLERWLGPNQFGTSDCFIIDLKNWRLIIFDWKWGAGVPVQPTMNDQGILYTLGVWATYAEERFMAAADGIIHDGDPFSGIEVWIVIEQPRAPGGGGVWETTMGFILAEGEKIKRDAERTRDPNAPRVPGPKQCQFCAGSRMQACPEQADGVLALFDTTLDELEQEIEYGEPLKVPSVWTPEARSQLLIHRSMIEKLLERLHADAFEDAQNGLPTPGLKLVDGRRPARGWKDEDKAKVLVASAVGADNAYTKKLLSPAQVEDTVGKRIYETRFAGLVERGEAKPQLVIETDGRDPMIGRLSRFDALSHDEIENLI